MIWAGTNKIKKIISDNSEKKFSFLIDTTLWYYNASSIEKPKELKLPINKNFIGLTNPFPEFFSEKGELLLFTMEQQVPELNISKIANTYSYLDGSFDMSSSPQPSYFKCCYNISSGEFTRIEHDDEKFDNISGDEKKILISSIQGSSGDYYWNKKSTLQDYLLYIETEEKKNIVTGVGGNIISPSSNFVIGFNEIFGDIICSDLVEGITRNLTSKLPIPLTDDPYETPRTQKSRSLVFIEFLNNDKNILIRDHYDLWLLDSKGESDPINITNEFGRRNHISFKPLEKVSTLSKKKEIILSAFDEDSKESGFYKVTIGEKKDPELLSMGPFVYSEFKKSKDKNIWIIKRMSTIEAPNFFSTSNFKDFKSLSDVRPEKKVSWFSSELIKYTTKKGVVCNAILYKPDDFDSTKKYPVLFNFYEHESSKLNAFLLPDYTSHYYFNIPIMVGRGYIVCVPDIHFEIGETANSIVDCVEGAVDYISHYSFIDSTRMGASGGSFGGYGVNCLAAFSTRFKAIASISGVSDLISGYGNVPGQREEMFENRQLRMGVSLSTDPQRYLRNSPVAYAKEVKTPVLIVIAKEDHNVNVQQGIEWFISLRREGKPSWLIQYNSGESNHGIWGEDQKDLYVRMNQLFDHYLKMAPAPRWMTEGISNKETRLGNGFDYNEKITTPPPGLLKKSI